MQMAVRKTKQIFAEITTLCESCRDAVYKISRNMVDVFEDKEFCTGMGWDDFDVIAHFDEMLSKSHIDAKFDELRTILEEYPEQSQWNGKTTRELYSEAWEAIQSRKKKPVAEAIPQTRRRVSLEVLAKSEQQRADAEYQLQLQKRETEKARNKAVEIVHEKDAVIQEKESYIQRIERENAELKAENSQLKSRIAELEQQLRDGGETA